MYKIILLLSFLLFIQLDINAQIVNIPDANFKAALLDHGVGITGFGISTIDTNGDGEIQVSEAQAYSGTMDVHAKSISDITGIQAFTALIRLSCSYNQLTSLDLSANIALDTLHCHKNQLTNLNISSNTHLSWLNCSDNQLTSLGLATNVNLGRLNCSGNQLTSLGLATNVNLDRLYCSDNQLTILGLATNTNLTYLDCNHNQLTNLNVSTNTNLELLYCHNNLLTNLDISANIHLSWLNCSNNQLTSLGLATNVNLYRLYSSNNQLTSLGLSNNTALSYLDCSNNQLTNLGLSANTALSYLNCSNNQLTNLGLSANTTLTTLYCSNNLIASPNLSANTNLERLGFSNNQLVSLDISANTKLERLICANNQLTSIDLSNNTKLTLAYINNNQINNLNTLTNTDLRELYCNNNQLTNLDLSANTNLAGLYCDSNQLTNLDLAANVNLAWLYCNGNQLTNLDLAANVNLAWLYCNDNQLTNLDLAANTKLGVLYCNNNQLASLDLFANTFLELLHCKNNLLTSLNISNNTSLFSLDCTNNVSFLQVCVSDVVTAQSNSNWTKDPTASYTENCHYPLALTGTIATDNNNNCQVDSIEQRRNNTLVSFNNGGNTSYAFTNQLGTYQAHLDTGMYTVTAPPPNLYFTACPSNPSITIDTNYQVQTVDFAFQETISCPYLEIDISTPLLRRCFNSTYYVDYCNTGTLDANNAYVEVELDTNLYFNSSSIPLISQTGSLYRFNIGNLPKDSCGRFSIDVTVSCASQMGQVHCASAHIYPDFLCSWHLPNIQLTDTCLVDSISFTVLNLANAVTLPYLLLEDTLVVDTGSFHLNNGQFASILYPTNGGNSTYQLVLANGDPIHYAASALVGCHSNSASTNLLHSPHLPQDFADIDCTPNRGSYDPNDKTGFPLGYTNAHYIHPNTTIDYRIRFQNTGTDTAIFINILDTISPYLDLSTLTMGTASHPYNVTVMPSAPTGEQILRFEFNPIYLPDSNVNEPASNGFIQYSIAQLPNLPNGTVINNSASIYFDYNAPVKTNTTSHTVCDNCLPQNITNNGMVTINVDQVSSANYSIIVAPNPFSNQTRIELQGYNGLSQDLTLEVYDMMGRLQQTILANDETQFLLERKNMPTGVYFFQISEKGKLLQSGRLIAQ